MQVYDWMQVLHNVHVRRHVPCSSLRQNAQCIFSASGLFLLYYSIFAAAQTGPSHDSDTALTQELFGDDDELSITAAMSI